MPDKEIVDENNGKKSHQIRETGARFCFKHSPLRASDYWQYVLVCKNSSSYLRYDVSHA